MRRLLVVLTAALLLTGCGSSGTENYSVSGDKPVESAVNLDGGNYTESGDAVENGESTLPEERKIIQKYNYRVETKDYDKLIKDLTEQVNTLKGYVESSTMYGTGYNVVNGARSSTYVIRVPKKSADKLVGFIGDNSVVTSKEMTTEDVTLKYVDVESRLKALKTEKESLEKLLASATSVTDTIAVRDRLTTVIYEIESYTSQLKTYDNQIEYTTVTIDISEVEQPTVVEEQTMLQEIYTGFKNNLTDVGKGIRELVIWCISSIPYFVIFGIMLVSVIAITKFITKLPRKGKKRDKEKNS